MVEIRAILCHVQTLSKLNVKHIMIHNQTSTRDSMEFSNGFWFVSRLFVRLTFGSLVHAVGSSSSFQPRRSLISPRTCRRARSPAHDDDFGMTNLAAGTMIRQVGEDEEPIDLSDVKNVEASSMICRPGVRMWWRRRTCHSMGTCRRKPSHIAARVDVE
jgi:hypothetical protein